MDCKVVSSFTYRARSVKKDSQPDSKSLMTRCLCMSAGESLEELDTSGQQDVIPGSVNGWSNFIFEGQSHFSVSTRNQIQPVLIQVPHSSSCRSNRSDKDRRGITC